MHAQQLTTFFTRPFGADDYPSIARLQRVNFPEFSMDADEWRFEDEHRPKHCRAARWVADWSGRVVGFAQHDQHPTHFHPRKYMLELVVDPDYLGRGIGRRLYDLVLGELSKLDALEVDAWSREDMPGRVRFFARRGFVEDMRLWTSELDLTSFQASRYGDPIRAVERQGLQIRTLDELGQTDQRVHRTLYDLWLEVRRDVPHPPSDELVDVPFELYWERHNRPQLVPQGLFVAVDGERYVGMTELLRTPDPTVLRTGLTGVRAAYRRLGIALALKLSSLAFAQSHGYAAVQTDNESNNRGMLAINGQLGFVRNPAWVHYLKSFHD